MKNIITFLLASLVFPASAQHFSSSEELQVEAQRARIQIERKKALSIYEGYEARCYQRFAVNDCLRVARNERRDLLADLRRQELSLNSVGARRKGANTIRRLEEKAFLGEHLLEAARPKAA